MFLVISLFMLFFWSKNDEKNIKLVEYIPEAPILLSQFSLIFFVCFITYFLKKIEGKFCKEKELSEIDTKWDGYTVFRQSPIISIMASVMFLIFNTVIIYFSSIVWLIIFWNILIPWWIIPAQIYDAGIIFIYIAFFLWIPIWIPRWIFIYWCYINNKERFNHIMTRKTILSDSEEDLINNKNETDEDENKTE